MTLYFPHIPKCGGSTVRQYLNEADLNCFIDYDATPSVFKFTAQKCERRNSEFRQLDFRNFDLVYGHFPLSRYRHENNVILLLRHPVERAVSHFNYFKHLMPATNYAAMSRNRTIEKVRAGEMDIVQFAKANKLQSFITRYIGDVRPEECRRVFFTDHMSELFSFFNSTFALNEDEPKAERVNSKKSDISPDELAALTDILSAEIRLYEAFEAKWG